VHSAVPDNPLDAANDDASRAMLADVLATQVEPVAANGRTPQQLADRVAISLAKLRREHLERRQRELRVAISEAERRGDTVAVESHTLEKMKIDRALRER